MRRSASVMLFPLFAYAGAMHMALMLFAFKDNPTADHVGMLIWWAFLAIDYVAVSLFVRRPRELRSIVLLSGGVCLGQLGVTIWLNPIYPGFLWWAAAVCMWAALYYRCASGILQGVKPETLMTNFEVMALSLFACAVIVSGDAMDSGVLLHLAVGLLCSLVGLMGVRTMHTRMDTQGSRPMVRLLPSLLLVGIGGSAVVFVLLISGRAAQLLTRFTAWLLQVAKAVADGLGAFFLWFFSLFPEVEGDLGGDAFEGPSLPSGNMEGLTESNGILLYILIGLFIAALLFLLVRMWRKVQLQGVRRVRATAKPVVVKRRSLWSVLRQLLGRIAGRVGFELHYLRSRNTAAGLLVWLQRNMRRKRMGRKRGETVSGFLCRVAQRLPDCTEELQDLSKCLDRRFFGSGDELPPETVRQMRKKLRKAMNE